MNKRKLEVVKQEMARINIDILRLSELKDVLFFIGDWNAKVGSQEIPGVIGKFVLGIQNEAGQSLKEFCQSTHWS